MSFLIFPIFFALSAAGPYGYEDSLPDLGPLPPPVPAPIFRPEIGGPKGLHHLPSPPMLPRGLLRGPPVPDIRHFPASELRHEMGGSRRLHHLPMPPMLPRGLLPGPPVPDIRHFPASDFRHEMGGSRRLHHLPVPPKLPKGLLRGPPVPDIRLISGIHKPYHYGGPEPSVRAALPPMHIPEFPDREPHLGGRLIRLHDRRHDPNRPRLVGIRFIPKPRRHGPRLVGIRFLPKPVPNRPRLVGIRFIPKPRPNRPRLVAIKFIPKPVPNRPRLIGIRFIPKPQPIRPRLVGIKFIPKPRPNRPRLVGIRFMPKPMPNRPNLVGIRFLPKSLPNIPELKGIRFMDRHHEGFPMAAPMLPSFGMSAPLPPRFRPFPYPYRPQRIVMYKHGRFGHGHYRQFNHPHLPGTVTQFEAAKPLIIIPPLHKPHVESGKAPVYLVQTKVSAPVFIMPTHGSTLSRREVENQMPQFIPRIQVQPRVLPSDAFSTVPRFIPGHLPHFRLRPSRNPIVIERPQVNITPDKVLAPELSQLPSVKMLKKKK